ncbi:GDNF family receptor alpha-like [Fukomys damarensis]|uniref:GDNF family receptor alpha-like n=1 Tax=Fukomys damarensis TaxID=885580 RepID=UPI00053F6031|nr:GDNF family receptor alpha-like [Fukomys damarensis]
MIAFIFLAMGLSSENRTTSQTKDCMYLKQQCLSDGTVCKHAWGRVEDACGISDPGDSCEITNPSHCSLSIQSLVESNFEFKQCVCTDDLYCTVNKFLGIKCINKSDNIKEDNKLKWNLTTPSHHGLEGIPSCLEVTKACVGDVACNTLLAPYLKACSANGDLCDLKHCQTATRYFYQNTPLNVAQMLALCDCAQADVPCQQSREALHSKPCAVNVDPSPTCLDVLHSCRSDEFCRRRYRTFQSKCWPHVTEKCHEDETCISMLSKQDVICSGDENCIAAYLGILGTVLQGQCTCRAITQGEESLCKIFQQMLHRKSCFNYPILSNVKGIALYKRKHAKEITLNGLSSPINGEVIYAIMCMSATCGVLLIIVLKLRMSRTSSQTRDPSPIQIPGGVIIH